MAWNDEVDVVYTGAGAAGLAHALAVAEAGADVFVADSEPAVGARTWLDVGIADGETSEYFSELVADLGALRRPTYDIDVPIRVAPLPAQPETGRTVAPFVGSRLRDWAARCLATPYGFLSTRLPDWQTSTVQSSDHGILEVSELGVLSPGTGDVGVAVREWLASRAAQEDIEIHAGHILQRLVFEEGVAIGAVFDTADGPFAVRARHGVTVAGGGSQFGGPAPAHVSADATLRVCVVGQRASRFGRLELISADPVSKSVSPTCRSRNRRLAVNMRETYRHLQPWRCSKVHRYPTLGQ
ncbi:FAD-binding protein [Mycolicibacterium flavescens]|uniref:Uncharacterized protein n=1 Tax=Mycolicibacterium flavescens TaxID=1776 RepID=A0A1E3RSY1_MYCFV|nr:FAD-binding protein [Mycolicibacterium flavescens]MCV7279891.1 FAD-binding protein [Mycolicibacterium flavescens]ODQ92507.1 hypothetical protein BHQ18_01905 [Mycolicibacterium flavescens]